MPLQRSSPGDASETGDWPILQVHSHRQMGGEVVHASPKRCGKSSGRDPLDEKRVMTRSMTRYMALCRLGVVSLAQKEMIRVVLTVSEEG